MQAHFVDVLGTEDVAELGRLTTVLAEANDPSAAERVEGAEGEPAAQSPR